MQTALDSLFFGTGGSGSGSFQVEEDDDFDFGYFAKANTAATALSASHQQHNYYSLRDSDEDRDERALLPPTHTLPPTNPLRYEFGENGDDDFVATFFTNEPQQQLPTMQTAEDEDRDNDRRTGRQQQPCLPLAEWEAPTAMYRLPREEGDSADHWTYSFTEGLAFPSSSASLEEEEQRREEAKQKEAELLRQLLPDAKQEQQPQQEEERTANDSAAWQQLMPLLVVPQVTIKAEVEEELQVQTNQFYTHEEEKQQMEGFFQQLEAQLQAVTLQPPEPPLTSPSVYDMNLLPLSSSSTSYRLEMDIVPSSTELVPPFSQTKKQAGNKRSIDELLTAAKTDTPFASSPLPLIQPTPLKRQRSFPPPSIPTLVSPIFKGVPLSPPPSCSSSPINIINNDNHHDNTSNEETKLEVNLLQRTRASSGRWIPVQSNDRLRVTKAVGKRFRLEVRCNRAFRWEEIECSLLDLIPYPPQLVDFWVDGSSSSSSSSSSKYQHSHQLQQQRVALFGLKDGVLIPTSPLIQEEVHAGEKWWIGAVDILLKNVASLLQFQVRMPAASLEMVEARTVSFITHDNGKDGGRLLR
ncbi:hypothetical protein QOT17_009073 [Balamuthia mandrillaris]